MPDVYTFFFLKWCLYIDLCVVVAIFSRREVPEPILKRTEVLYARL